MPALSTGYGSIIYADFRGLAIATNLWYDNEDSRETLFSSFSVVITLAFVGVLLVFADGSLSAWLTLLARLCDFAVALLNFFKEVDCMKKVLAVVGKGASGVT